jgi:hypothetical protein
VSKEEGNKSPGQKAAKESGRVRARKCMLNLTDVFLCKENKGMLVKSLTM